MTMKKTTTKIAVPNLDFDEWDEMHTRLFDRHLNALGDLDDDAVLSMTTNTPRTRSGFLLRGDDGKLALDWDGYVGTAPVGSAERSWNRIERGAKKGAACYFGVAPRRGTTNGQGGKKDVLAHTLLAADIDWAEGDHQSSSNPPREVIEDWIADLPVAPGLVVNTGGGFHLYVTLDEPVDVQRDPRGIALYAGWRQWWIDRAREDGYSIDIAPLTNQALVLRVAGTPAPKYQGELVRIERSIETTDDDFGVDELMAFFPAPPEPEKKRKPSTARGRTRSEGKGSVPAGGSLKDFLPGDLFAVEGDIEMIVVNLLDVTYAGRSGDAGKLLAPWTDCETTAPEYPEGKNAGIYVHYDGTPLVKLWGQGVREDWAHFAGTTPNASSDGDVYNAFYCLAQVVARKGASASESWSIAARLVAHYRSIDDDGFADYGTLYDDLGDAETLGDVLALLPERRSHTRPGVVRTLRVDVSVTAKVTAVTWIDDETAPTPRSRVSFL